MGRYYIQVILLRFFYFKWFWIEFLNAAFEKESFLTDEKIESMFKIFDQVKIVHVG